MKAGQIITVKGKIYQLIKPIGEGNWEAKRLASNSIVRIQTNKKEAK